jgi:integrase
MATIKILPDSAIVSGINQDGTQFRKTYSRQRFGNGFKKIAQEKYEELLFNNSRCANSGLSQKARNLNKLTVGELAQRYGEEHLIHTRAKSNMCYVEIIIDKWGEWRLYQITPAVVRPWLWSYLDGNMHTKRGKPFGASTTRKIATYLIRIFNWGCQNEIIENNPLAHLLDNSLKKEFLRKIKSRNNPIPPDVFNAIIGSGSLWFQRVCKHAWGTGMRKSEIGSLKWNMIKENLIYFDADNTKEADSKIIPMEPEVVDQIEAIRLEQSCEGTYKPDQFVYLNFEGKPLTKDSITSAWTVARKKTGLYGFNFHDIRSTWENRKELEGHSLRAISAALGHHSSTMTTKHYRRVSKSELLELSNNT